MRVFTLSIMVFLFLLAGCGEQPKGKRTTKRTDSGAGKAADEASNKAAEVFGKIHTVLEGVKDTKTAQAAVGELTPLIEQLGPQVEKAKGLAREVAGGLSAGGFGGMGKAVPGKAIGAISEALTQVTGKVASEIKRISQNKEIFEPLKGQIGKLETLLK